MTNRTASPASPVPTSVASAVGGAGLGRRHFLVAGAGVAGACVLVACSPGADSPEPTGGSGGSQATPGGPLVALADVPVGGAVSAKTGAGDDIVIAQPQEGTVVAFSAICTHQGCVVAPDGAELVCPCHGSVYESATGANVSGPAPRPLPAFAVEVKDGQVVEA